MAEWTIACQVEICRYDCRVRVGRIERADRDSLALKVLRAFVRSRHYFPLDAGCALYKPKHAFNHRIG